MFVYFTRFFEKLLGEGGLAVAVLYVAVTLEVGDCWGGSHYWGFVMDLRVDLVL